MTENLRTTNEMALGREAAGTLDLTSVSISSLKLDPANPRTHSKRQIQQLAKSIQTFGFVSPILVDDERRVIAGHGRVAAAKRLGFEKVPTISIHHLSQAQLRALMIADNRLAEQASWNELVLGEQLKALSELDLDFELEATGFEMGEIDVLIEGLSAHGESARDQADELPPPAAPVSEPGDLWILGRHRLLCGNALNVGSLSRLMESRKASVVFTDPPFNVKIDGHVGGLGKIKHREFAMASGEMSEGEFTDFLTQACNLLARYSQDGALHYIFMDWRHVHELLHAGTAAYSELKALCVWNKGTGGMGSLYRSQHELIFVFKSGSRPHRNNIQLGQFGRYRTNIWDYPGLNSFSRNSEEGNLLEIHPTVKPVALVADAIMDSTARSEIVLDPFLGSGTTIVAAERTGRIGYGLEIDPVYVDTAVRRWQAFTGLAATHSISGRSFGELEVEGRQAGNER